MLNGEVTIGDKVAWAVREGNNGALRTGTVVDIVDTGRTKWTFNFGTRERTEVPIIRVKMKVEHSSGYYGKAGSVVGVEIHDRIAKLS